MRVHHVGYLVKKLARAKAAFETLGYETMGETTRDEVRGIDILFMKNGAEVIELVSPFREGSHVEGIMKRAGNAPYHICYLTEDIERDVEALSQNGYVLVHEPLAAPAIGGKRVAFLMSAAIGLIELVEE